MGTLIESMLGDRLPEEVVALLYERNGGSPYWIQETLRYLVDRGLLRREGAGWMLVEPSPQALEELLPSPDELFEYRFGHLEPEERQVLEVMALHRFPVGIDTLRDVLELEEERLRAVLGSLQQKGWIEENRSQGGQYRLVQPPLRRLISQTLRKRRRRELHRRLAAWYARQPHADRRFVIWHLFAAGRTREARQELEQWLEEKRTRQALRPAEEFLEQLMTLEGTDVPWLLERVVELQFLQGRYEAVVRRADQIREHGRPLPLLYLARAWVYLEHPEEARSLVTSLEGRRLPRRARMQWRLLAYLLQDVKPPTLRSMTPEAQQEEALLRFWKRAAEGGEVTQEALDQLRLPQEEHTLHLRLQALLMAVRLSLREGWLVRAERFLQELRECLTHELNLWGVMQLEWLSGEHAYRKGEWMTALAYMDRDLRYAERLDLLRTRRHLLHRMAHLYWRMGDWSRARRSLLRAGLLAPRAGGQVPLDLLEIPEPLMTGDPLPERFRLLRKIQHWMAHDPEAARNRLQEAMQEGAFAAFPVLEPDLLYLFGTLYPHAREEVWERALDLAEHRGDRWLSAALNLAMAELYAPHDPRMGMNLLHRSLEHVLEMHRLTLPEDREALRNSPPLQVLQEKIQGLFQHLLDFRDPRSLEFFQRILGRVPATSVLSRVGEGTADLLTTTMMDEASIQSLIRLTLVMSNVMDREEDLSLLLDVILEHLHADRGVLLWKESDGEWRTMARRDRATGVHRDVDPVPELVEEVERTENPVLVEDVLLHPWKKDIPPTEAHTLFCLPLKRQGNLVGLLYAEADQPMYRSRSLWSPFLDLMLRNLTIAVENVRLTAKLQESFKVALRVLVSSLEARDAYTIGHSENVRELCMRLGERLGLSRKELDTLEIAAILHDVGKIGIPDNILLKKGQLTPEEFERVKEHTLIGERIVAQIPGMQEVARLIRSHHERWDGSGYPDGLSGEAIPFLARVIAVCYVYDALVSLRPYREALGNEDALRIM
ncbi:MAG: HD domain-containing protein, partial [Candidatus Hydrothermae bacterium]|nr:HD domain-containing protein [Candidatus Hydrothermae bacterium]